MLRRARLSYRAVPFIGIAMTMALALAACARAQDHAAAPAAPRGAMAKPPQKIVLLDSRAHNLAANWRMRYRDEPADWPVENGAITSKGSDIMTKEEFGDFLLHVEFKVPYMPEAHGQERGNSGIGLQGRYEIQILDSYGIADPGSGDCGAVYNQSAPLFNACKPPLEWQKYDIYFRAPRLDTDGKVTENPRVTVLQNGIVVQNNTEIRGPTGIQYAQFKGMTSTGPIVLQFHNNTVQFRNVWIVPLPPHGALHY